jgi:hypothetical protein
MNQFSSATIMDARSRASRRMCSKTPRHSSFVLGPQTITWYLGKTMAVSRKPSPQMTIERTYTRTGGLVGTRLKWNRTTRQRSIRSSRILGTLIVGRYTTRTRKSRHTVGLGRLGQFSAKGIRRSPMSAMSTINSHRNTTSSTRILSTHRRHREHVSSTSKTQVKLVDSDTNRNNK